MMPRKAILNSQTGEVTIVDTNDTDVLVDLDIVQLKTIKMEELVNVYKDIIVKGFYSSATGESIFYGYSQQDQLNYSKWANVFALNPAKESIIIGSVSHGVVSMTREQFIQFMADAETYEVGLYEKKVALAQAITQAGSVDKLHQILIELS